MLKDDIFICKCFLFPNIIICKLPQQNKVVNSDQLLKSKQIFCMHMSVPGNVCRLWTVRVYLCTNSTWYSCPGPVLASIISHLLQCSTWYKRSSWRGWTRKGSRLDDAVSISSTSELVLLLQLMLSICRSLERETSTNTLGKYPCMG